MSLNGIQLTPHLLASLYPDVLIETDAIPVPVNAGVHFLGGNEKNILIVTNKTDVRFLTEAESSFLTTVLSACKLSLADVAIINWKNNAHNLQEIFVQLKPDKILLFDTDPGTIDLPINFPHFQIQEFDKRTYLYAPSLAVIENEIDLKKALWTALKKLFGI